MRSLAFIGIAIVISISAKCQYNKDIVIESVLKTDTTSIGQKIVYPTFQESEVSILRITIPPGKSTGWHKHEFPVFAYVLKGVLTVEIENHETLEFFENTSFSEVLGTYHSGTNNGTEDLVLIAFYMGEKGRSLSDHKEVIKK